MTLDEIVGQIKAAITHVEDAKDLQGYVTALQDLIPVLQDVIRVVLKGVEKSASAEAEVKRDELKVACGDLRVACDMKASEVGSGDGAVGANGEILRALLALIEKIAPLIPLFF